MPLEIVRNDITRVRADAIVNTANPLPTVGEGVDSQIYRAAGLEEPLAERRKIGIIYPGTCEVTPAFRLQAKYIIHTVGPAWEGGGTFVRFDRVSADLDGHLRLPEGQGPPDGDQRDQQVPAVPRNGRLAGGLRQGIFPAFRQSF